MKTKDNFSEGAKVTKDNQIFAGGAEKNRSGGHGSDRASTSSRTSDSESKQ